MPTTDFERIRTAIEYVAAHFSEQPTVDDIAQSVHLSPYHFTRLFRRWAGVSPKQFLQHTTLEYAKGLLAESRTVLDAAYASGLSGPGRLHDHFVTIDAVTPGEYKSGGQGVEISYGIHATPFGDCLIGVTSRGVCRLRFVDPGDAADAVASLHREWPGAALREDPSATRDVADSVGAPQRPGDGRPMLLRGTNFQVKVWQALVAIPPGAVVSYGDVAAAVGHPTASRAVGTAVGANPVAYFIPCHRVLRNTGGIGGYRWGVGRKVAILGWEATAASRADAPGA
ncbi:methylated-DNA--[protein]-cysteine S-methyltransferase [Candidatus Poribacteria bacterium]|jgi:AraC family transcriptional regulator, regulatory protein of adaptative response / methylated-DNA-[protein]-cysteine methyltransferase|nr:methylated-DNA--[protein]-cysteine S-methyltransferase [Candidatus Poribacteria bacterium]MBT5713692.1 methylated-DNA--[protein]-cysteine S-methyltransferase [Candidatus Poribacteria bacterium]MBT7097219.1 methylated-DNA--[protein]-cysteine S-methyltransferase [Candidatus Poribacteria bacterium]MBT7807440.1 methylated-DNA--[protein]-cysteine S-methyltransferase [Candidatus Poribacteria bacterium]